MIFAEDELVQVPHATLGGAMFDGTRPAQVGDHVLTKHGWGKVVKLNGKGGHRGMIVALAKKGPYLDRQDFPEWDAMRWSERLTKEHIANGKHRP